MNDINSVNILYNSLLSLIKNHKKIILSCISLSLISFLGYLIFSYVPLYSTSVDVFIRNLPSGNVLVESDPSMIRSESGFSNPLFNFTQLLTSEELSSRVYADLQEKYPQDVKRLKPKKNWKKVYNKLVKVKLVPSSDVIAISMNWPNKKNAKDALNIVVKNFKDYNIEIRKSVETKQREYLDSQLEEAGNNLDDLRTQIAEYKIKNNLYDFVNEGSSLAIAKIDVVKQKELLKADLSFNERKLKALGSQLNMKNATEALRATGIGADPYLTGLNSRLAEAQQDYARISSRYTDNYPEAIEAKGMIAQIKNDIAKRKQETLNQYVIRRGIYDLPSQDLAREMAIVEGNVSSLRSQLSSLDGSVAQFNKDEGVVESKKIRLLELLKEEEALAIAYSKIKEKQLEAKIRETQIVDNISALGDPDVPKFLLTSLLIKFLGFILLGILSGLGIAWIIDELEDNWSSTNEIEMLTGKKVLGTIPWLVESPDFKEVINEPNSILSVSYKNIINNLTLNSYKQKAQSLVFLSTVNNRGSSFIAQNTFISLAKAGKSVILIDTDFMKPRKLVDDFGFNVNMRSKDIIKAINYINKRIRVDKESLTKEYMDKVLEEIIIEIPLNEDVSLNYLSSERVVPDIYGYISTPGFAIFIDYLKTKFDFIIIDTPGKPLIFPETSALTNIADAIVLISGMSSNRQELKNIVHKLDNNNLKILGIITREKNSELECYVNENKEPSDEQFYEQQSNKLKENVEK